MPAASILILMLCNVLWALNVVVSKLVVDDLAVPPLFFAFCRSLVVACLLFPAFRQPHARLAKIMLIGLAIGGGSFALLFMGLKTASPSAAGIVSLSGAPMTVLFAVLLLGEKIHWRRILGIVLTLAGVGIAIGSPSATAMGNTGGLLLVFAAGVVGALGSVYFKQIDVRALDMQAWAGLSSALVLLPLTLTFEGGQWDALANTPTEFTAALLFAGVVVSIGAHTAYYRMLQQHDANLVVPLTLLTPLLTIAFGALITGDTIGWPLIIGGGLAMAGVAIIILRPSSKLFKPLLVRPRL